MRRWGTPRAFDFTPKDHVDVGAPLGLDFDTGVQARRRALRRSCAGRWRGCIARSRSSCSTCRPREHGYTECYTPYIVNREVLEGTGQLPKFKDDMFWVTRGGDEGAEREQYLIPTSESR